jgi:hypothetical protein
MAATRSPFLALSCLARLVAAAKESRLVKENADANVESGRHCVLSKDTSQIIKNVKVKLSLCLTN